MTENNRDLDAESRSDPDSLPTEDRQTMPSGRHLDRWVSVFVFVVAFVIYAATCCRAIYTGDDGDFVSAIATFGIPHPTGYPLFVLFGHLWITLTAFLGDVPFRLNVMTAMFGAAGATMFCRFLCDLLDVYPWRRVWAATGALVLAFAPTYWQQSLSVEVYAPNVLFLTSILYLILGWIRMPSGDPADRRLCWIAVVYGFALTNHMTMALFFPAFMALAIWRKPTLFGRDWPILLSVIGCLLLPLSLYIYVPMAAKYSSSPSKWGLPTDGPSFWAHLTGVQYQDRMFASHKDFTDGLTYYLTDYLPSEYGIVLLLVGILGVALMLVRRETRPLALVLVYIYVADVIFSAGYHFTDIYVYYIPSYLVLAAGIATTGGTVTAFAAKRLGWTAAVASRYERLAALVLVAAIFDHMSLNYAETDESGNFVEADYGASILHSCPPHAVLAVRTPTLGTLLYRQSVLHDRLDVLLISQDAFPGAFGGNRWYLRFLTVHQPDFEKYLPARTEPADVNGGLVLAETLQNFLHAGRPIIVLRLADMDAAAKKRAASGGKAGVDPDVPTGWHVQEQRLTERFDRVPWGFAERLYDKGHAPSPAAMVSEQAPLWTSDSPPINPRWGSIYAYQDRDSQQTPMFFRIWESLVAWGKEAEAGGRPDLAVTAYTRALKMYDDANVRADLARCEQKTGAH